MVIAAFFLYARKASLFYAHFPATAIAAIEAAGCPGLALPINLGCPVPSTFAQDKSRAVLAKAAQLQLTGRQIVCDAGGAEGVVAYRGFNSRIRNTVGRGSHHPSDHPRQLQDTTTLPAAAAPL